jgi:hypothetical protein
MDDAATREALPSHDPRRVLWEIRAGAQAAYAAYFAGDEDEAWRQLDALVDAVRFARDRIDSDQALRRATEADS